MGRLSVAVAAFLVAALPAVAQTPAMVLGTTGGAEPAYQLFTPRAVVEAGGGGGEATPLSDTTPLVEGTASAGTATAASRGDHVHPANPLPVSNRSAITALQGSKDTLFNPPNASHDAGQVWTVKTCPRGNTGVCAAGFETPVAGAQSFTGLTDTPSAYTGEGGKFVAVNSGATALEFVDKPSGGGNATPLSDATPEPLGTAAPGSSTSASRGDHVHKRPAEIAINTAAAAANAAGVARLQDRTADLQAGAPSTGWQNAAANSQGGVAVRTGGAFTLATAKAATYAVSNSAPGEKFLAARIPVATGAAQARILITGTHGNTALLHYTSMTRLGADDDWQYYGESRQLGAADSGLQLQLTGSAAHVGTSRFAGIVTGTIDSAALLTGLPARTGKGGNLLTLNSGATALAWQGPHDAVLAGLPAITGQGGKALTVNTAATGLEWKATGGGSGGGGGSTTLIDEVSASVNSNRYVSLRITGSANSTFRTALAKLGEGFMQLLADCGDIYSGFLHFDDYPTVNTTKVWMGGYIGGSNSSSARRLRMQATAFGSTFEIGTPFDSSGTCDVTVVHHAYAGGGGGSSGPTIPTPTVAGKLKHLRVNAAGAAYELTDPPAALSDAVPALPQVAAGKSGTSALASRADHSHQRDEQIPLNLTSIRAIEKLLPVRQLLAAFNCAIVSNSCSTVSNTYTQPSFDDTIDPDGANFSLRALMSDNTRAYSEFWFYLSWNPNSTTRRVLKCIAAGEAPGDVRDTARTNWYTGIGADKDGRNIRCQLQIPNTGNHTVGIENMNTEGQSLVSAKLYGVRR